VDDDGDTSAVHHFWSVERPRRIQTAAALVSEVGPTVVFCRTKRGTERVARQLTQAGVTAVAIHGDRSQGQRDRALEAFRRGDAAALVATDVAARGIHVDDVACVLHFDLAADGKAYVHRSGRTARAGAAGVVVTLVPSELTTDAAALQRELGFPTGLDQPMTRPIDTPRTAADTARATDRRRPSGAARRKAKRASARQFDTVASLAQPAGRGSPRPRRGKPANRRNKQGRRPPR
jgi:superfamily II DNA/RNA helicase